MARNLYRFYLYIIFIGMLILAATGLGMLLQPLLALTPLHGGDSIPASAVIVQAAVFAVVAWFIALALGGSHYWLIRRDMRADPAAGSSGVRAFFLNATEAVSVFRVCHWTNWPGELLCCTRGAGAGHFHPWPVCPG